MRSLSAIAANGTISAMARTRRTLAANSAVAATGVKFGECGAMRATTPSAIRRAISKKSFWMAADSRIRNGDMGIIGLFPRFHCIAPEYHVQRLQFECCKAAVTISRVDPILPVLLARPAAVARQVIDLGKQ